MLDWSELEACVDNKIHVTLNFKLAFKRVETIGRKRRKCWLPAFSPPTVVFKRLLFQGR